MIHLLLPNVGPMPPPTEWKNLTGRNLVRAYQALPWPFRGSGECSEEHMMRAVFYASNAELSDWIVLARAGHNLCSDDLDALNGVIWRRWEMVRMEYEEARLRLIRDSLKTEREAFATAFDATFADIAGPRAS
ncbi:hypothetical protein VTL71DRAFT_5103 [Oculimacula yallundae]|uniref:Uncharacterized protein n=1 Tax=Oculimacula yallundae TaxID=86028 RepID=A0ABR4C068_9HELO